MADDKTITQADLDKLTSQIADLNDRAEKAEAKYTGAMDDLKKAQRELRAAKDITPEAHQAEIERADRAEAALADASKAAKDALAAADKATKALETEQGFTHRLVAENGLMQALSANGVTDPAYLEAAKAMHIGAVKVVSDGDNRKALYGDKELAEAIKEWSAGDVGKKFVAAPVNGGGGAQGGGGSGGGKTITRSQYDANPVEGIKSVRAGVVVVDD